MSINHCQTRSNDSNIKVEERAAKAIFTNQARTEHILTRNDNCVMSDPSPRADWVVTKIGVGDLVIELKGRDVERALIQVALTIDFWRQNSLLSGPKLAALIVCRQHPSAPAAQKALSAFRSRFTKSKLTVTTYCVGRDFDQYFL